MASDEVLLDSVAEGQSLPVLRFYRWKPVTMTLGYGQSVRTDLDLDVCREAGLDVVRRSTGGRAVLHDEEVTYAVIAPLNSDLFGNSVVDCYRVISHVLQKSLIKLGLPAKLVPGKSKGGQLNQAKAVCFSAPSQYELLINDCKVAGSAQKRHGQAFLQHGSIPIEMDVDLLGRALRADSNQGVADSLATVGWLNRYSSSPFEVPEVEKVIAETFSEHLQIAYEETEMSSAELGLAKAMSKEKFANDGWNLKR